MKEGYTIKDQERPHFITCTVVDWIDIFSRKIYKDIVISSLQYCIKEKGMILFGYVIMSNHIHLIVQSKNGLLSDLIRDFKKFTSKTIVDAVQTEPESRRDWMLDLFKKATAEIRITNFGNTEIMQKRYTRYILCGINSTTSTSTQ